MKTKQVATRRGTVASRPPLTHRLLRAEVARQVIDGVGDADHPSHPPKENQEMALRPKTLSKAPDPEEPAPEMFSQRRKPDIGQFRLQVDRQTKASFTTLEAAEVAGLEIKKNFPVVRVAVYDTIACTNQIIELPTV
jgi:hypothetical protein